MTEDEALDLLTPLTQAHAEAVLAHGGRATGWAPGPDGTGAFRVDPIQQAAVEGKALLEAEAIVRRLREKGPRFP